MKFKFQQQEELIAARPYNKVWEFLNYDEIPDYVKQIKKLDKILILCPTTNLNSIPIYSNNPSISNINYDICLGGLYNLICRNDSSGQEWDLNSKFINEVYQTKSTNCYISMRDNFSDHVNQTAQNLYRIIEDNLKRKNKKVFKDALRFNCCWLSKHLHRMYNNKHYGLRYHRANRTYVSVAKQNKLDNIDFRIPSAQSLMSCIDILVEEGFAYTFKGFKNSSFDKTMLSLLLPTTKMFDLITPNVIIEEILEQKLVNLVEIRDKNKRAILEEFYKQEWILDIEKSKQVLDKHNELILSTDIKIDNTSLDGLQIMRIHNDGDISKGGRLYDDGTWTTMKKVHRKRVTIGGHKTITIDLSHLHPSLLYAKKGIDISNFDPYSGVDIPVDQEFVDKYKKYYNIENYNPVRNAVKLALLIMVNANSEEEAALAIDRKLALNFALGGTVLEDEMKFVGLPRRLAKHIIPQIKEHNAAISEYFCTGVAKDLMRTDSDIILETLNVLVDKGVCALPLHDSITVAEPFADIAEKALHEAYKKVVGSELNYKVTFE